MKRKIKKFLMQWDGVWSVPLLMLTMIAFGITLQELFGQEVATYDPGIIQAAFLTMLIMVFFTFAILLGLRFNFNVLYQYYIAKAKSDFNLLSPWQRVIIFLSLFGFFFFCFLVVLSLVL